MVQKGTATIEDLLLLFIYLEIGSMVGIYFRTNHMPVRFLLYVGITALTRHLIGFVQHEEIADAGVLVLAGGILILALAVLVIRFASNRFPAPTDGEVAREARSATARSATNERTLQPLLSRRCFFERLRADGGQGRRRRDRVGIDLDMQDRRQAGSQRAFVCGQELGRLFHRFPMAAEGARIGREIGIAQRGAR